MNKQPDWLERAKETYSFHRARVLAYHSWSIKNTSKALKRSVGGVSEDILIARYSKRYEKQLERFDYIHEALAFIREKKKEQDFAEID